MFIASLDHGWSHVNLDVILAGLFVWSCMVGQPSVANQSGLAGQSSLADRGLVSPFW